MLKHKSAVAKVLGQLRFQALVVLICAVVIPYFIRLDADYISAKPSSQIHNAAIGSLLAAIYGLMIFRRLIDFPNVAALGFVIPVMASCYSLMASILLISRMSYSSFYVVFSFGLSVVSLFIITYLHARWSKKRIFVIPFGKVHRLVSTGKVELVALRKAVVPQKKCIIVADLHVDLDPEWERMLATAVIRGHTVYHYKQLGELLTGKVTIEHLSENNLGSLVPNRVYNRVKRLVDLSVCTCLLIPVTLVIAAIAIVIKMDSRGPVFFLQNRRGYKGDQFRMVKLRTMHVATANEIEGDGLNRFMTQTSDARITRVGNYLRKTRLDELPQFFNVLMGQMSLIGPRPEAIQLSHWYEGEIPFYTYRHIVRPGISGWAQVHQGHVSDVDAIYEKLSYDFYYIKNFSAWLDILIAIRTFTVMVSGFGAK